MFVFIYTITVFIVTLGNLHLVYGEVPDKDCLEWFKSSKVQAGEENCTFQCTSITTDLNTFICPDQCDLLCKKPPQYNILGKFIYYPGLTQEEKKLVEQYPNDALAVYEQKQIAEKSTNRNFPNQERNDESDAFRHFIWSGLLTKEIGREKAKRFLDAHEQNPLQSERERLMDQLNNSLGQSATEKLIEGNDWSIRKLETKALKELRNKKLQVLSPRLMIPMEPK